MKWQAEHEVALNSGPRPSDDVTEAGACTQFRLKVVLPRTARRRREKRRGDVRGRRIRIDLP